MAEETDGWSVGCMGWKHLLLSCVCKAVSKDSC